MEKMVYQEDQGRQAEVSLVKSYLIKETLVLEHWRSMSEEVMEEKDKMVVMVEMERMVMMQTRTKFYKEIRIF